MKSKPDVDGQGPAEHRRLSRQYLENAKKFLQSGRFEKASEMFWGAVAASVRAVAEARGNSFRTHRGLRDYIRGIAKETGREELPEQRHGRRRKIAGLKPRPPAPVTGGSGARGERGWEGRPAPS
jgi:hypothetical protein